MWFGADANLRGYSRSHKFGRIADEIGKTLFQEEAMAHDLP